MQIARHVVPMFLLVSLASASTATAQWSEDQMRTPRSNFGRTGQIAIGAERLFGITVTKVSGQGSNDVDATSISLLNGGAESAASPYSSPRLTIDGFVVDGLSLGGFAGFATVSTSSGGADGPTATGFLFGPRVGYAYMFNNNVGVWPHGGVTFYSVNIEQDEPTTMSTVEETIDGLAISLDVALVLSPAEHFAFTLTPTIDVGVSGSDETSASLGGVGASGSTDIKFTDFGLHGGIMGWF